MEVRSLIKSASLLVDRLSHPDNGVVILIYHRVGADRGGQMNLSVAEFDRQVEWLMENHRVLSLGDAADELARGVAARPGVVLTFDDGTADWGHAVIDVLSRHGAPATMYVATRFVEEHSAFPDGCAPISWSGLAELLASGLITVGSHTHSHALLDRVGVAEARDELRRSVDLIGDRLGIDVEHFAYPKALRAVAEVEPVVRELFRTATLAGTRANRPGADLHRLARSPIQACDTRAHFEAKASGGMHFEDDLRSAVNRLRQWRASV